MQVFNGWMIVKMDVRWTESTIGLCPWIWSKKCSYGLKIKDSLAQILNILIVMGWRYYIVPSLISLLFFFFSVFLFFLTLSSFLSFVITLKFKVSYAEYCWISMDYHPSLLCHKKCYFKCWRPFSTNCVFPTTACQSIRYIKLLYTWNGW